MEDGATTNLSYAAEHIHAPTNLGYDKNGNSTGGGGDYHWFDVENRLSQINVWTWTPISTYYLYDASGEMVRRNAQPAIYPTQAEKDVFVAGIYQERSIGCAAASSYTKYYTALGRVIASRSGTIGGSSSLSFYAADHLGSTSTTISGVDGTVQTSIKYWPFGSIRSTTGSVPDRAYTGQQKEPLASSNLGMYYYHARFYSPQLSRFISADPTGDALNRYSYVSNNPTRYVDPTGLWLGVVCGHRMQCEKGVDAEGKDTDVSQLGYHIYWYWKMTNRFGQDDEHLQFVYDLMIGAMQSGWTQDKIIEVFDVGFFDTDNYPHRGAEAVYALADFISQNPGMTIAVGYSWGATILRDLVWANSVGLVHVSPPKAVLLLSGISDDAAEWADATRRAPIGGTLSLPFGWDGDSLRQRDTSTRIIVREGDVPFEHLAGKAGIAVDLRVDGVRTLPNTCADGGHCAQPAAAHDDMAALMYLAGLP